MYSELMKQYEELTDEEKNALLVYKALGVLMNDLDGEPNISEYFVRYKKIYSSPQNFLIKNTILKNIDFTNVDTFRKSLVRIKGILDEAITKIVTPRDMHVYRCISSNKNITGISKSECISTSLSFAETIKYANAGSHIVIYDIKIPAGSRVGVSPYSVLNDIENNRLILTTKRDQEEIILNLNNYEFEVINESNNDGFEYREVIARDKEMNYTRK